MFWSKRVPLLLFIFILSFYGCTRNEVQDEDRIREIINVVVEAAEKKDIKSVRRHISKRYKDLHGNNYDSIKGLLAYHFIMAEKITIFLRRTDVEVEGDRAFVESKVVFVRGREVKTLSDILPESASGYRFNIIFEMVDREWRALEADWEEIGLLGLL